MVRRGHGAVGLTFGVSLYENLNILRKMWSGRITEEENARETVALTLLFGDETEISVLDLEAVRKHGWDVAGPEAYPLIFRKERGMTMLPPLAWELELMEAASEDSGARVGTRQSMKPGPCVFLVLGLG